MNLIRFRVAGFSLVSALSVVLGCSREQTRHSAISRPSGETNGFVIHLQEGFYQGRETVITVDGREVYRGVPTTKAVLGFAEGVAVTATSAHFRPLKGIVRDTFQNFKHLRKTAHTHNPVDDAKGNAEALLAMKDQLQLKIRL